MTQILFSSKSSRILTALLAVWMMVFAVAEAVHTHGPLTPAANHSSIVQPSAGGAQPDICLACLASHSPASVAGVTIVVPVQQKAQGVLLVEHEGSLRCAVFSTLSPRAPPTPSTTQA